MDEFRALMDIQTKFRELVGLLKMTEAERDRYRNALVKIRDSSVDTAAIAEEALCADA